MNNHLTLKHEFRDYYYFDTGTNLISESQTPDIHSFLFK